LNCPPFLGSDYLSETEIFAHSHLTSFAHPSDLLYFTITEVLEDLKLHYIDYSPAPIPYTLISGNSPDNDFLECYIRIGSSENQLRVIFTMENDAQYVSLNRMNIRISRKFHKLYFWESEEDENSLCILKLDELNNLVDLNTLGIF
jgi:hypothetical protein